MPHYEPPDIQIDAAQPVQMWDQTTVALQQALNAREIIGTIPVYGPPHQWTTDNVHYVGRDSLKFQGQLPNQFLYVNHGYEAPDVPSTTLSFSSQVARAAKPFPTLGQSGVNSALRAPSINEGY